MPASVLRDGRVDVGRDEPEVRGREFPFEWVPVRLAERLELLQVGELPHIHLLGEMAADCLLERLAELEEAAREGPRAEERLAGPLPEQDLQPALAHLE